MRRLADLSIGLAFTALAIGLVGCATVGVRTHQISGPAEQLGVSSFEAAHEHLERAIEMERAGNAGCVDAYFFACRSAWLSIQEEPAGPNSALAWNCYNEGLASLLFA